MVWSLFISFLVFLLLPLNISFAYLHEDSNESRIRLEIDKSERTLYVMLGNTIVDKYRISIGSGGLGDKLMRGDNTTPLGEYRITRLNPNSKYDYFMGIDYPNLEDADRGLMKGVIGLRDYVRIRQSLRDNKVPPQDTRLGGYIGIHGPKQGLSHALKELQSITDWTQGCIALPQDELTDLRRYCTIGTKVIIRK